MIWGQYFPESHSVNAGKFAYHDVFRRIFGCALLFFNWGTCLIHFAQQFLIVPSWVFSFFCLGKWRLGLPGLLPGNMSGLAQLGHGGDEQLATIGMSADYLRSSQVLQSFCNLISTPGSTDMAPLFHDIYQKSIEKLCCVCLFFSLCLVLCCVEHRACVDWPQHTPVLGWTPREPPKTPKRAPRPKKERPSPLPDSFFSKEDGCHASFFLMICFLKVSQETEKKDGEKKTTIPKKSSTHQLEIFHDISWSYDDI